MAVVKHIKSRNANYSDTLDYLLYQHDEKTRTMLLDQYGYPLLRDEFYMDGLNCRPSTFDVECRETNRIYKKNRNRQDIKSHHYIISFDPKDVTEHHLTGMQAQELSLGIAKKLFPGHQALIVTHTDGGNHSGNIHTHIVINSVRKFDTDREDYMTQPCDNKAGMKHRSTKRFLDHFKKEVMEMCEREGLHQIDLLAPAPEKITENEYRSKNRGQKKLDQTNQKIREAGITPAASVFQTQKDFLRTAIRECSASARSFEEFQSMLLEKYNVSVIRQRGRYRYLHPDREKRITEKSLGTDYGREHLEQLFIQNETKEKATAYGRNDYLEDPLKIFLYPSRLRLVVDLQNNIKAMQSQAYAEKVMISNLQQMAHTLIYVQEQGYDSRSNLEDICTKAASDAAETQNRIEELKEEMRTINSQIRFTGTYFASKTTYAAFLKSKKKGKFRKEHAAELSAYEEARDWLRKFYDGGKILPMTSLKKRKSALQQDINVQKGLLKEQNQKLKELETVSFNVDAILGREAAQLQKKQPEKETIHHQNKERKETIL